MKISVVILAYNEEENIIPCIESLAKQTKKPHELIAVNDGSKDDTLKKINEYNQKNNEKITIIDKKENKGRAKGYESGFRKATGDIIAFLDADSEAPKEWIEEIEKEYEKEDEKTACLGGYYIGPDKDNFISRTESKYNRWAMRKGLFKYPAGTNMAYRKEIAEKEKAFENLPKFKCDRIAMDRLMEKGYKIKVIDIYVYSKTPNTLKGYLKQKFRWGRGNPSAGLTTIKDIIQKTIIVVSPSALLLFLIIPIVMTAIAIFWSIITLSILIIISRTEKEITFIELIQIAALKSMGLYAHSLGYIYEVLK